MIESGVTYDRNFIKQYFERKKAQMERERTEFSDEDSFEEESYFVCPVKCVNVNPDVMLVNKRII